MAKIRDARHELASLADADFILVDDGENKKIRKENLRNTLGVDANTAHRGSDGKDHSDVVLNNTHRASDGKDHSDVVLNNTHRTSDGSDHSKVTANESAITAVKGTGWTDENLVDHETRLSGLDTLTYEGVTYRASKKIEDGHLVTVYTEV